MNKGIVRMLLFAAMCLSMASCGTGSTGSLASSNLGGTTQPSTSTGGGLAGALLGGATSGNAGSGLLGGLLSNILGSKTTESSLVGTWTYSGPKVVFESENVLAKLGGAVASNKVEETLGKYLGKMGLTAGKSKLTLNQDKTCTFTYNGKTVNGTYAYDSANSRLTITGALGMGNINCTASVVGNELHMLFDADKLLSVMTGLGSSLSQNSSLSSLLKKYNGLQMGWTMTR